jgi:hypothetical protein
MSRSNCPSMPSETHHAGRLRGRLGRARRETLTENLIALTLTRDLLDVQ